MSDIKPNPLTNDSLRIPLERLVSEQKGRQWKVKESKIMADFACHPAAILSDGSYSVFAKYIEAANGYEQFEIELSGLRLLSKRAGVLTPTPIGIVSVRGSGSILVLETVQAVDRTPLRWRQIGQALARIHKNKWDRFGLETNGYIGNLHLDNTPSSDWATFYAERRLWPGLRLAIDSGNMPPAVIRQVEKLIERVPGLCGLEPVPTLLHGDAQQNNFMPAGLRSLIWA